MKVTVEENNPFVTVRVSLDRRKSGDSIQSVDTNFVIKLLEDRGIKISNIRKSAIIDNYTTNVPNSGEWKCSISTSFEEAGQTCTCTTSRD